MTKVRGWVEHQLLDRYWLDPVVALVLAVGIAFPGVAFFSTADHSGFYTVLCTFIGSLLTLAVLAITISLSRDLSPQVRLQLKDARAGFVGALFGSLLWLLCAALLACGAFLVDHPGFQGYFLTCYLLFVVTLALIPTVRIGWLLVRLFLLELSARD